MKILVATKKTQGQKKSDFNFLPEGEIVDFPNMICSNRTCGCDRSLVGVDTHKATTTVVVTETSMIFAEYQDVLRKGHRNAGWPEETLERSYKNTTKILKIAKRYPVGTVLEWSNGRFERRIPISC